MLLKLSKKELEINYRNYGLDLARFIAIFLVLFGHSEELFPYFMGRELLKNGGYFGVELFFVLSGYLIGKILISSYEKNSTLSEIVVFKRFMIRRLFRTVPNYILFLILNLTLFSWFFGTKEFSYNYWFFVQNFAWPNLNFMPESWSLTVEEWFYLSFPLCFILAKAFLKSTKRSFLVTILLFVLIFVILRIEASFNQELVWDANIRKVVIFRLDSIAFGVLFAYLEFYHRKFVDRYFKLFAAVAFIMLILLFLIYSYGLLNSREDFFYKTIFFSLTSVGFALLMPWFYRLRKANGLGLLVVTYGSLISYSMYLLHISLVRPMLLKYGAPYMHWSLLIILYFILNIILSILVFKYYEIKMTNIREKFL